MLADLSGGVVTAASCSNKQCNLYPGQRVGKGCSKNNGTSCAKLSRGECFTSPCF